MLFLLYNLGRLLAAQRVSGAFDNADRIWRLERWVGLPSEQLLQALVLDAPGIVQAANGYYASVHFPLTFLVLLWLFLRRPAEYPWVRWALVAASAASLLVQVALPTAPPRMLTGLGFTDTGIAYGQSVYGAVGEDVLSNQFAAMPSLHVGWALLVAVVLIRTGRTWLRWLWGLHPIVTTVVVVVTANHFWLDALAGAFLVVVALTVAIARQRRPSGTSGGRDRALDALDALDREPDAGAAAAGPGSASGSSPAGVATARGAAAGAGAAGAGAGVTVPSARPGSGKPSPEAAVVLPVQPARDDAEQDRCADRSSCGGGRGRPSA